MTFMYKDNQYEMAETLRVAYKIQEINGHKPYTQVFKEMGDMPVEKQIKILYAAFELANPGVASELEFREYCLDNMGMEQFTDAISELIEALMYHGLSPEEIKAKKAKAEAAEAAETAK